MSIGDIEQRLHVTAAIPATTGRRPAHPTGREYEWDGNAGYIRTEPLAERPKTWDEFLVDSGLDPAEVEVVEPVQVRGWDANVGDGNVVRMHYYRLEVRRRVLRRDIDKLIRAAKRRGSKEPAAVVDSSKAFLLALGDLQLGKMDGDGAEGTVARYIEKTAAAVARYRRLNRERKHAAKMNDEEPTALPVYLIHLGDCIEGFVSQGGANTWRTTLTLTEQVELYQQLLLEQVKAFAAVAPQVVVVGIPGNHDEANRPLHTYSDSWALQAVRSVNQAIRFAGGYDHVTMHIPERDELTVTLDICGTVVGMAHGHQWRPGQAVSWWAKQAHGRQPIGDADILLSAHLHHLRIEHTGSDKTWLQVPALESGSQWWKHRTGEWGQPGIVTALVGGGSWSALEIL